MICDVGLRSLALAVLRSALRDLQAPEVRERDRALARQFLAGGELLELWATLAGVDPTIVSRAAFRPVRPPIEIPLDDDAPSGA